MNVLKPYGSVLVGVQRLLDALLVAAALYAIKSILDHDWSSLHSWAAIAGGLTFVILGEVAHLYGSWRLRSMDEEFRDVLLVWAATCGALIVGAFLLKLSATYSRLASTAWFLMVPALLIGSRLAIRGLLRALRKAGRNTRTAAVVGNSTVSKHLSQMFEGPSPFGVSLLGIFDDRSAKRLAEEGHSGGKLAGTIAELIERSKRGEVDYVFIALPMRAENRIIQLVNELADTTTSVYVVPDLFVFDLMRARWVTFGSLPAVSVYESPFDGLSGLVKRAEDLVLATAMLAAAALPMLAIAIGLKLTGHQSVFFRQKRYGLNGRVVRVLKFRTMTVSEDGANVVQARRDDPRVTPFGQFLRKTSLDELPQLLNVLLGDMSLVGPRPHAVKVNEDFRRLVHGYMLRHKVKPGITGWAQVNGWHGEDTVEKMQQRVEHDLAYLQNWSLWLDLKIIALTISHMFVRGKAS